MSVGSNVVAMLAMRPCLRCTHCGQSLPDCTRRRSLYRLSRNQSSIARGQRIARMWVVSSGSFLFGGNIVCGGGGAGEESPKDLLFQEWYLSRTRYRVTKVETIFHNICIPRAFLPKIIGYTRVTRKHKSSATPSREGHSRLRHL